jgi:hypothetical protein
MKNVNFDTIPTSQLLHALRHNFMPLFHIMISCTIHEPRDITRITYSLVFQIWSLLLIACCGIGSIWRLQFESRSRYLIEHLNVLAGASLDKTAHPTTLSWFLSILHPEDLQILGTKMLFTLIRRRSLEAFRLLKKYYLIAIDGTQLFSRSKRHCSQCLVFNRSDSQTSYEHRILTAQLLTHNGMAFSAGFEPIQNLPDGSFQKQDCETNAAYRFLPRLKKYFPQLPICLLFDGLFATRPMVERCRQNNWQAIITFKSGSMPVVFDEYERLLPLHPQNIISGDDEKFKRTYRWVNDVDLGKQYGTISVIECLEVNRKTNTTKRFVWLTTFVVDIDNAREIADQGGRIRWKIENEGNNVLKNGGYELGHVYARDTNAMHNMISIIMIAFMIRQLLEKMFNAVALFGSRKVFGFRLLESLRCDPYPDDESFFQKITCRLYFDSS